MKALSVDEILPLWLVGPSLGSENPPLVASEDNDSSPPVLVWTSLDDKAPTLVTNEEDARGRSPVDDTACEVGVLVSLSVVDANIDGTLLLDATAPDVGILLKVSVVDSRFAEDDGKSSLLGIKTCEGTVAIELSVEMLGSVLESGGTLLLGGAKTWDVKELG